MAIVIGLCLLLIGFLTDVTGQIMDWALDFFTSKNGFIPGFGAEGAGGFYSMFDTAQGNLIQILENKVIIPVGAAIVIVLLSIGLYKSIISDKVNESPAKTIFRGVIGMVLVFFAMTIFSFCLTTASNIQQFASEAIVGKYIDVEETNPGETPDPAPQSEADRVQQLVDGELDPDTSTETDETAKKQRTFAAKLVSFVICLVLTWKYLKLVFQYLSRYVRSYLLIVFSPLAGATFSTDSTAEIWWSYVKMFLSSLVSVILSQILLWGMKLAILFTTRQAANFGQVILYFCLTTGYAHFAENLDTYLAKLKLDAGVSPQTPIANQIGMFATRTALEKGGKVVGGVVGNAVGAVGKVAGAGLNAVGNVAQAVAGGTSGSGKGEKHFPSGIGKDRVSAAGERASKSTPKTESVKFDKDKKPQGSAAQNTSSAQTTAFTASSSASNDVSKTAQSDAKGFASEGITVAAVSGGASGEAKFPSYAEWRNDQIAKGQPYDKASYRQAKNEFNTQKAQFDGYMPMGANNTGSVSKGNGVTDGVTVSDATKNSSSEGVSGSASAVGGVTETGGAATQETSNRANQSAEASSVRTSGGERVPAASGGERVPASGDRGGGGQVQGGVSSRPASTGSSKEGRRANNAPRATGNSNYQASSNKEISRPNPKSGYDRSGGSVPGQTSAGMNSSRRTTDGAAGSGYADRSQYSPQPGANPIQEPGRKPTAPSSRTSRDNLFK